MAFPRVPGTNIDVPQGPTGHLSSDRKTTKPGGDRKPTHEGSRGLTNVQMKIPCGPHKSLGKR